jgi:lipopolysaccharide export system protein LptA
MATTYDSATTQNRSRTAGSGIVLSGDRAKSRSRAFRHSMMVRLLRVTLPLAGVAVIGVYSLSILKTTGWGKGIPDLVLPSVVPDNIPMINPHYDGFTKDGGKYWFTAKTAHQDLKNLALVTLDGITGEMTDAQKSTTHLTAARGLFNNKTNILELYDAIDTAGDNGMKSHLTRATVKTKDNIITSNEPVVVMMEAGTVNANTMVARHKVKEYTFVDKVRTFLKAHAPADSPADPETGLAKAAKAPPAFGNPNEPTDILSNRLDVDDLKKTALFTGNVKAVQGTSSLTTPEMFVSYEGTAAPAGAETAAGTAAPGSSKVTRILAKGPVVITQADGQTVTSRSADIDTVNQKTVLDGDVAMIQIPDKKATGDKAEVDQAADTVLLTGNVVVLQGQNQMKGRRLFYNRKANTMQLTSPGQGTNGRTSSHFQQQAPVAPSGKSASARPADPGAGLIMGSSFKSDPKAPVDIESDRVDIDDTQKKAVFTGDVRAVQGESGIRCAELTVYYSGTAGLGAAGGAQAKTEPAHVTRMQARKNVVITSKDGQSATGDTADFDTNANTGVVSGNVVMTQGKNVVHGTKLNINMATGESVIRTEATASSASEPMTSASGTPGSGLIIKSGRPSAVFYPNMLKEGIGGAKALVKPAPNGWDTKTAPSNGQR